MVNLSIVVCGAPLASRAREVLAAATERGWDASLAITGSALAWLPDEAPDRSRPPKQPRPPRPDAVLVLPLTFNTANKWALGLADNRPLGLLCEALGADKPIVAVPMVNESLWSHPRWPDTLHVLTKAGVVMVDPSTGNTSADPVPSGRGDALAATFDPSWAFDRLPDPR